MELALPLDSPHYYKIYSWKFLKSEDFIECPRLPLHIKEILSYVLANGRIDHITMFTLYLPFAVFRFSVKLSSFALASKVRIIVRYSHLCNNIIKKT